MSYVIDKDQCVACGACEFYCNFDAIEKKGEIGHRYYEINSDKCRGCGLCVNECIRHIIKPAANHRYVEQVSIDPDKCIGCSLCQRNCVAAAISGVIKKPFSIDPDKCIKCTVCADKCKKDAIIVSYKS